MDEDDRQGAQTTKTPISYLLCSKYLSTLYLISIYISTPRERFLLMCCFASVQYASEDAELLLVGNKLDCESGRAISRQQAERVRAVLF